MDGTSVTLADVRPMLEAEVAKWALDFERRASDVLQRAVDAIPHPKDGKDGRDGVGFDDLTFEHDGERTVTFKFVRGDHVKQQSFRIPAVIYRGVWKAGQYEQGDAATYGGSVWVAECDTDEPPKGPSNHWKLAVKAGRDAK